MFHMGYFHLYYKDGTTEKVEIIWGENVGYSAEAAESGASVVAGASTNPRTVSSCRETIFTCDFLDEGGKRYYRFVIPTKKPVARVETEIFEKFAGKHELKSIEIHNVK